TELIARAMSKYHAPDQISVQIENLGNISPRLLTALDVVTIHAADPETGRSHAARVLHMAGVSSKAVESATDRILGCAAPSGGNMRGAMILDAETGERLEPDQERGVRASRFDWTDDARVAADRLLSGSGLIHFRIREALALATKVVHAPCVIAELCWSDDPDYTAGYAASIKTGYVRFPFLKQPGDNRGGRAIFINRNALDLTALLHYLQAEAVLISAVGTCRDVVEIETYFSQMRSR
ncbi:MAG TPA: 6-carboxyhexanoate--CoA ligase, partial [Nitrospirota bacterium]|nr:6-carboxyhexanoate--CoA ligase [Nitrospirota bacterium]